jgi:hypothetical protein
MSFAHRRRVVRPISDWWIDLAFWATVVVALVIGGFFLRHDFSPCNVEYEICD